MSEHQQAQNTSQLNANLVAFIFIFTFSIIGILVLSNMKLMPPQSQEDSVEVAQAEATATLPPSTPIPPTATPQPTSTPAPTATVVIAPATQTPQAAVEVGASGGGEGAASHDPALVAQGEQLFLLCSACHGPDARGLPNLGKDLVASEFVAGLTDQELMDFIKTGRPIWDPLNTTGIDMPAKGGNPAMTDADIEAVIAYIRSLEAAGGGAPAASVPAAETPQTAADAGSSDGNGSAPGYDPALVAQGEELFLLCSACHGPDARGLPNLGKDLVASEFVAGLTDEGLLEFVKTGRPIWDALNTTGIDMPAKGGNPAMTDEDIVAIIAYIRTLSATGG